jgi:hypothetical protein
VAPTAAAPTSGTCPLEKASDNHKVAVCPAILSVLLCWETAYIFFLLAYSMLWPFVTSSDINSSKLGHFSIQNFRNLSKTVWWIKFPCSALYEYPNNGTATKMEDFCTSESACIYRELFYVDCNCRIINWSNCYHTSDVGNKKHKTSVFRLAGGKYGMILIPIPLWICITVTKSSK